MAKKKTQSKPKLGRPFAAKKPKLVVAVTLEADVVKRLDDVARLNDLSRSRQVEQFIIAGLDEGEFAVKAFANPAIVRAMGKMFADRSLVKQLAQAITADTTPEQLRLFEQGFQNLEASFDQPPASPKKRGAK
jgi:hypothetical protein